MLTFILSCSNSIEFGEVEYKKDNSLIDKGAYLFNALACQSCHGNSSSKSLGKAPVPAPSLNNSKTNLGSWSVSNIVHFFKSGEVPKGFKIIAGVHEGYEWLSDRDLLALASFLKTLPVAKGELSFREKDYSSFNLKSLYSRDVRSYVPAISKSNLASYGKYIADHVTRCSECHGGASGFFSTQKFLGGGKKLYVDNMKYLIPSLNGEGEQYFLNWQSNEIYKFLKTGVLTNGKIVNSNLCPTNHFSKLNDKDSEALLKYFNSF